jgi:hypothetical protein
MAVFPSDSIRTKNWGSEVLTDADLEAQFDLLHAYLQASLNATTGHAHTGASNQGPKISPANLLIASQAQGDVLYASSSTAWARLGAGTDGYLLKTQGAGANPEWVDITADTSYLPAGSVVQVVNVQTGAVATGTTAIPEDDTIPQITEGDEYMTLAITPKSATNKLKIDVVWNGSHSTNQESTTVALFQDTTAGALAVGNNDMNSGGGGAVLIPTMFTHYMDAGTTSATTFRVRAGANAGATTTFNGILGARKYGGVLASSITISEVKV